MVKIIVAFPSEERCSQYASTLEEAGYDVFRRCQSGSEVKRTLNQCHDGIVICAWRMPDCTADSLAWDIRDRAMMLATGRPEQLEMCECPDLFRLPTPCTRGELSSAVSMLVQLYQMKLPRRSKDQNETIAQAKALLMARMGLTEAEAHRYLQRHAMNKGMKLAEYAGKVLENREDGGTCHDHCLSAL